MDNRDSNNFIWQRCFPSTPHRRYRTPLNGKMRRRLQWRSFFEEKDPAWGQPFALSVGTHGRDACGHDAMSNKVSRSKIRETSAPKVGIAGQSELSLRLLQWQLAVDYSPLFAGNPACSKRLRTRPVLRLVPIARSIAVADPWRTIVIITLHSLSVAPTSPRVKRG